MADFSAISQSAAITFLVSGGLMYEAIAASCSSPQTTEINAGKRATTLMKWVYLGIGQGMIFVIVAAIIAANTGGSVVGALAGGGLAAVLMYASYWHAKKAGLANQGPGTEG